MKEIEAIPSQLNLARLLLEIRKLQTAVRSSLARSLRLSFATVSNLTKVLEEHGYICNTELRHSSGGRRAAEIRFNPQARYSLALLVEHDLRTHLALLDLSNRVVEESVVETDDIRSAEDLVDVIACRQNELRKRHAIDDSRVIGAGVAIPGVFNHSTGVIQATTSPALANLNLKDRLQAALGCAVHIHNDADMAALAISNEPGHEVENFLLIYFTEGIGLGIMISGSVYTGECGFAGELGHTRWGCAGGENEPRGSVELKSLVSVQSLLAEYDERPPDDEDIGSDWRSLMDGLCSDYAHGRHRAVTLLEATGQIVGQLVGTLVDIFDPGVVAIGGRVRPILPFWLPIIRERARESSYLAHHRDVMIAEAPDLEPYILSGCGETAFQEWIRNSDIAATATWPPAVPGT